MGCVLLLAHYDVKLLSFVKNFSSQIFARVPSSQRPREHFFGQERNLETIANNALTVEEHMY